MASRAVCLSNILKSGDVDMKVQRSTNASNQALFQKFFLTLLGPDVKQAPKLIRTTTYKEFQQYFQGSHSNKKYEPWTIYMEHIINIMKPESGMLQLHTSSESITLYWKRHEEALEWYEVLTDVKSKLNRQLMDCNFSSYIPIQGQRYTVYLDSTARHQAGVYTLVVGDQALAVEDHISAQVIYFWPYSCISRFGYKNQEGQFVIETSQTSDTGQGIFSFKTSSYKAIIEDIKTKRLSDVDFDVDWLAQRPPMPLPRETRPGTPGHAHYVYSVPYEHRLSLFQRFGLQTPYYNTHRVDPNQDAVTQRCVYDARMTPCSDDTHSTTSSRYTPDSSSCPTLSSQDHSGLGIVQDNIDWVLVDERARCRPHLPVPSTRLSPHMTGLYYSQPYTHVEDRYRQMAWMIHAYENHTPRPHRYYSSCDSHNSY